MTLQPRGGGYVYRILRHSRAQLALKAGLAAALSWIAANVVTGALSGQTLDDYIYYAPLGAVVATSPTISDSATTARQSAVALVVGAGLGLAAHQTLQPDAFTVAVVVAAGIVLGALPGMGAQRSWVPIVAFFVLVIGDDHPTAYAAAYVGLTALGGCCGVIVNLLLPATRLNQGHEAVEKLRESIARQLSDLVDALRQPDPLTPADWRRRSRAIAPDIETTRQAISEMIRAQRGNLRSRFHTTEVQRQRDSARVLERVAMLVEDLPELLSQASPDAANSAPLDTQLATMLGDSLDHLAALVRNYQPHTDATGHRLRELEDAVQRLTTEFGQRRDIDAADLAVLGAVVANIRSSLTAVGRL